MYDELKRDEMKRQFTIGIVDDVTNLSLPEDKNCPNTAAPVSYTHLDVYKRQARS